jgi:CheY-like chemotaxis protein
VKKILLVDHQKSYIEREASILRNRGLQILTATSAEEAVALHKTEKVHLIVTALDMPGTGGDALCSLIRKDRELKSVSVIIICENRKADLDRCVRSGANAFITKPFDPSAFLDKVSRLIEIPKRSGVRVLIKVAVKGNLKSASFFCSSVNISTSGILLETDRALSKGDLITCSFFIPGSDGIEVDCEVMRAVSMSPGVSHCGARFLGLHPHHESAIEAFVRKQTR